jgi:hypothetical protein
MKMTLIRISCRVTVMITALLSVFTLHAQESKTLLFDTSHGQNGRNAEVFGTLLPADGNATIKVNTGELNDQSLQGQTALILFSLTRPVSEVEKKAVIDYLKSGGSLLLIFDEERRTPLQTVGVNDIIAPFGITLTGDAPVRHNCGAIALKGDVCKERRELPYSGGRSVQGGIVISKVHDEGDFVHSAYKRLPQGGKIVVMSDGMAGLLMGGPEGERFSGTGPSDSKYWGKDSRIFMQEVFAFLLSE